MRWIPLSVVAIIGLLVWKGDASTVNKFIEEIDHILTLLIGGGIGAGGVAIGRYQSSGRGD